jgi:acylphosphatase
MPGGADLVCLRWVVEGRVQGVGYRWYAMNHAQALGVRGWVRNRDDGAVEVVGLATAKSAAELEALLAKGPPGARVARITKEDVPHQSVESKSFQVKH